MKTRWSTLVGILLTLSTNAADESAEHRAEQLLREGDALQALHVLSEETLDKTTTPERAFWMGRILLELKRPRAAANYLRQVPKQHKLFPFAARGLLYCAQICPELDLTTIASELSQSRDEQIATLAFACLVEQQLRYSSTTDLSDYEQLREKAKQMPELQPLVKLLSVHALRHEGNYSEGIERARLLENDPELSLIMRQRVRLALAELYYDKEKATPQTEDNSDGAEMEEEDIGKGEETLLQFITANADSALLDEAFRRLHEHGSVEESEYTREKLREWMEDTTHPDRAALAILAMMRRNHALGIDTSSLANLAAAELPGNPTTRLILQEHIRYLLANGLTQQTLPYHALLSSITDHEEEDARVLFLKAHSTEQGPAYAAETFLLAADEADEALLTPSIVNALICAMVAKDTELSEQILSGSTDRPTRCALMLAHARLLPPEQKERALAELKEVLTLSPTDEQSTDVLLTEVGLTIRDDPDAALARLLSYGREQRAKWTDEQELHYAALVEKAADLSSEAEGNRAEIFLKRIYKETASLKRKEAIALHLADRHAQQGEHALARDILLDLSRHQTPGEDKAATLLYAGRECERCGTLPSLEHAVRLFADCVRQDSSLSAVASIEQASVLARINRMDEAFVLLSGLDATNLPADQQASYYSVLADSLSYTTTAEALQHAIETCERIFTIPELPHVWLMRARLQHAALCTRAARDEVALQDYLSVMNDEKHAEGAADPTCRFMYYYAGAGAVYKLLQMEKHEQAADLAEKVSNWASSVSSPETSDIQRAAAFERWARSIRQMHYLPAQLSSI